MVILGSQAEFHKDGTHLLLRTYFTDSSYAYIVQNLHGGMPVALCEERFETAQEAMRKAEEVAARAVGTSHVAVRWQPTKSVISRDEVSRIVALPVKPNQDFDTSAG